MTTKLAPFQYKRPGTLGEVFALVGQLRSEDRDFIFSGGGTDVVSLLKQQIGQPDTVISLSGLDDLRQISVVSPGKVRIGSLVSLTGLTRSQTLNELVPSLAAAAKKVASPQIRNQATIGGNILVTNRCIYFNQSEHNRVALGPCFKADGNHCHVVKGASREKLPLCRARVVSDTVPVLLVLDAMLVVSGIAGDRRVRLREFYRPDGIDSNGIQPEEVLSYVEFDVKPNKKIIYDKLSARDTLDFPSLGVAVAIETAPDAKTGDEIILSIALTGVHTHPEFMEFRSAEFGSTTELLNEACREATRNALTFQQDQFPRSYRKKMVEVYVRRAVQQLMGDSWT
jgi:4-hydroxybenzoyl-CoA reductase subunit beta